MKITPSATPMTRVKTPYETEHVAPPSSTNASAPASFATQASDFARAESTLEERTPAPRAPSTKETPLAARTAALLGFSARAERFAAIDMGSSSAKLLVVERAGGRERILLDRKISTRLGADVPNGGAIPDENRARTHAAIRALVDDAGALGIVPGEIALVTTAVMRNATNGGAFLDELKGTLGLGRARILSGDEEAAWGYLGTIAAVAKDANDDARFATLDLGGGSFQLAVGDARTVLEGASTQVGSNTLLAGVLKSELLDDTAFAAADAWLDTHAPMPLDPARLTGRTLVATGGVSKFLRVHMGQDVLTRDAIDALRRALGALTHDARVPVVMAGKSDDEKRALGVDTVEGAKEFGAKLTASATLLLHIMDALDVTTLTVSETDTRHALVHALAKERTSGSAE